MKKCQQAWSKITTRSACGATWAHTLRVASRSVWGKLVIRWLQITIKLVCGVTWEVTPKIKMIRTVIFTFKPTTNSQWWTKQEIPSWTRKTTERIFTLAPWLLYIHQNINFNPWPPQKSTANTEAMDRPSKENHIGNWLTHYEIEISDNKKIIMGWYQNTLLRIKHISRL